jgi:hypothetical protein
MGWLFTCGMTRREMISERAKNWETTSGELLVKSTCLAHCYRGGAFSGVLWAVWERTFQKDGQIVEPTERWITCDLLRYQKDYGWGYKDMDESMHPYFYSCPLGYLAMVPIDQFGGNADWRQGVQEYRARQKEKRRCA